MKYYLKFESPLGPIVAAEQDGKLTHLIFDLDELDLTVYEMKETALLKETRRQIGEYFQGERKEFDLPLAPEGTEFMINDWEELKRIPYGETRSYKDIAVALEKPNAARAVGLANNRNPISIIIPCHRVIGADGKMVGYGGGIDKKIFMLDLEKKNSF